VLSKIRRRKSLVTLRHGLTSANEVLEGMLRTPRVSFRLFHAMLATVYREIDRSAFFNPLNALEFRPEFDRIKSAQVLDLIRSVPGAEAHRLVALTFLSLFRSSLPVVTRRIAADVERRRQQIGSTYMVLSVLRSDARALSELPAAKTPGLLLAEGFRTRPDGPRCVGRSAAPAGLRAGGHRLMGIRSALREKISGKSAAGDAPRISTRPTRPRRGHARLDLRQRVGRVVENLRPALQNAVLFLGKALGASLEEGGVFHDQAARRETSERLRRDVWMFGRSYARSRARPTFAGRGSLGCSLQLSIRSRISRVTFGAMGYPLLRSTDYPTLRRFHGSDVGARRHGSLDPARLEAAIDECVGRSYGSPAQLFEDISKRDELAGVAFVAAPQWRRFGSVPASS